MDATPILNRWTSWKRKHVPLNTAPAAELELRNAYYAGATAALGYLRGLAKLTAQEGAFGIHLAQQELDEFNQQPQSGSAAPPACRPRH